MDDEKAVVEAMCIMANFYGVPCHVRQWFQGNKGWWCVTNDTYELVEFEINVSNSSISIHQR